MYFHSMGITWVEIANLFGVSRTTISFVDEENLDKSQVESVGDTIDNACMMS